MKPQQEISNEAIAAILAQQGMIKAELRALRDMLIELHGKTERERDVIMKKWAVQADGYYASVELQPPKILAHAVSVLESARQSAGVSSLKSQLG
jgi:hypothetical protein